MFVVSMPQKLYNKYLDKRDDAMDAKAVVEDSGEIMDELDADLFYTAEPEDVEIKNQVRALL